MSDTPRVSIVIPAYNASQWIGQTVQSVLAQSYGNYEVIVVDDGSTDDTVSVVRSVGEGVTCISKSHTGKASSRNVGIRASHGEYVAFVDADDLWLPQKLALQMRVFEQNPDLNWVYTDGYIFENNSQTNLTTFGRANRLHTGYVLPPLLLQDFIPSPTPVIRRRIFDEVGYFDETLLRHEPEDWDMWLRIASRYPIGLVNRPLVRYRLHPKSLTAREAPHVALEGQISIIERAVARDPKRLSSLKNRAIVNCYVGAGRSLAGQGRIGEARSLFLQAIRYWPNTLQAYTYYAGTLLGDRNLRVLVQINRLRRKAMAFVYQCGRSYIGR